MTVYVASAAFGPPPDGKWGWMVVFGSFIIHVVADGITYSFGLMFDEIVDAFDGTSRGVAAWIPSILVGLTLGIGPLASAITNRYGCRTATILGSLVAAFGCAISFFANGVGYLMLSVGVIMGTGCGLMYCPAIVVVTMYFERKRAFATGLAVCGAGLGTFLFSPLTNYLISVYAWRGAFLIYAGLLLNCAVCGALFRPLNLVYQTAASAPLLEQTECHDVSEAKSHASLNGSSLGPLSIDTATAELLNPNSAGLTSEQLSALSAKSAKSPSGGSTSKMRVALNPLNLPAIVEMDDDEDLAYAMNPHRKTSEHFLCELPLLEEKQKSFNVRNAVTPGGTPPMMNSPDIHLNDANRLMLSSVPARLSGSLEWPTSEKLSISMPHHASDEGGIHISVADAATAALPEIEGEASPDATEAATATKSVRSEEPAPLADKDSADSAEVAVQQPPRFATPLTFLRHLSSPTGFTTFGGRPVRAGATSTRSIISMPQHTPLSAQSSVASGGGAVSAAASISTLLARRQKLKQQAKAVEEKRHLIISEQAVRFLARKDAFYAGSLSNIALFKSNPDFYRTSVTSIPQSIASGSFVVAGGAGFPPSRQISRISRGSGGVELEDGGGGELISVDALIDELAEPMSCRERVVDFCYDIAYSFKQMTDLSLLKDPVYILYAMSNFLTSVGFNIPLVFLPDRSREYGLDRDAVSWLLSAFGIANTFGRVITGFISDKHWANRLLIYNVSLTLCGVMTFFSFPFVEFGPLLFYAAFFGLTMSAYVSLTSVLLVDLLGMDKLTSAFGLLLLWQGVASLIGPPVAGWIYEATGNYDHSFYFAGFALALSGSILFLIPLATRLKAESLSRRSQGKTANGSSLERSLNTDNSLISTSGCWRRLSALIAKPSSARTGKSIDVVHHKQLTTTDADDSVTVISS